MKFPSETIAETVATLKHERQKMGHLLLDLKKHQQAHPQDRPAHLAHLYQAQAHNIKILSALIQSLPNQVPSPSAHPSKGYTRYTTCLNYLKRDWQAADEFAEVQQTMDRLHGLLKAHDSDRKIALVLGAGTGRFAYDLAPLFQQTIAIDASITMGSLYYQLLQSDLRFFQLHLKNAKIAHDQEELIHASIQHTTQHTHTPLYATADACQLPLAPHSVSVIFSIYFTDVLPLDTWWPEVIRVLKPGGLFIHFGPLQYHFKSLFMCYAADDLRTAIQQSAFDIHNENWAPLNHLSSSNHVEQHYQNWSFVAVHHPLKKSDAMRVQHSRK